MNERFILVSIILFFVILVSEYVAYASFHQAGIISNGIETILMIAGIILPIIFIISMIYSYKHYSLLSAWANTISSIWLGIVLYIFIASLFIFTLIILNYYLGLNVPIKIISTIFVCLTVLLIFYGIINASSPRVFNLTIEQRQLSADWHDKKIIIISDVHLGTTRRVSFLKKIISKIEKEEPDIVFILGDLIDGPSFPYDNWLSKFSVLSPQFGIFYIEGNHEKYNQEYSKFKSQIPSYINNISDQKILINNTHIIGLDYYQGQTEKEVREKLESLNFDNSKPNIILIHDPKNNGYIANQNASLILSGHTHSGQFFPFTVLVNYIYKKYTHGIVYSNGNVSVTSNGVGTSIIPIRIGTRPEIIVLKIK